MAEAAILVEELQRRRSKTVDAQSMIGKYADDPIGYLVDVYGVRRESLDWGLIPEYKNHEWDGTPNPMKRIFDNMANSVWTAVESATGTGKTFGIAGLVLWFLETFENSTVVTVAPKGDQLRLNAWKEIARFYERRPIGKLMSLKLRMIAARDLWYAVGFIVGTAAGEDIAQRAKGFHAEHQLILIEEAPGVRQAVLDSFISTSTAPHNIIMAVGQPTSKLDPLHKFGDMDGVDLIRISAFDHPNIVLDDPNFIPGAQSVQGIERILQRYKSLESPLYKSQARGIVPESTGDTLIHLDWIRYCQEDRDLEDGPEAIGADPADSEDGDLAATCYGRGPRVLKLDSFVCPDSNVYGTKLFHLAKARKIKASNIGVDGVGVGAGTVNELKRLGLKVLNIKGGNRPEEWDGEEEFFDLRSQVFWQLRLDFADGAIFVPDDDELVEELIVLGFENKSDLKIRVTPKDQIKKVLGRSPNKADALAYWNWARRKKKKTYAASITPEHS